MIEYRLVIHNCLVVDSEVPIGDTDRCPYCGKNLNNIIGNSDRSEQDG